MRLRCREAVISVEYDWRAMGDDLGPQAVILLRNPTVGLEAAVVVDNVAAGPAIGGVRMSADVTVTEVARLARAMTLKNAAAGLRHGGAKAGIFTVPPKDPQLREALIRAFAVAIRDLRDYVPGPDMGTDEACMAWVHDEIGRCVGLPAVLGGIPLDVLGATGFGLLAAAEAAEEAGILRLDAARVAVAGLGAVGLHAARFLARRGARLVAASDSAGAVVDPTGLDVAVIQQIKRDGGSVRDYAGAEAIDRDELYGVDCDVLVPAARPDVLTAANAGQVRARLVLQGANIPATLDAEKIFMDRGVVSVPDFIANAGGVICGAVEYAGGTQAQAFAEISERIRANTTAVLKRAAEAQVLPRQAAEELAVERVRAAMALRRRF